MDTGKVLLRQLRYCGAGAETEEQRQQVEWWRARVAELRAQQPDAEAVDQEAPQHRATGTEGGGR